jgi:acyl-CoA thioesterase-1
MKACGKRGRAFSAYGLLLLIVNLAGFAAEAAPIRLLAFGDSLTAGYNLPPGQSFADQLEAALKAKGYDVTVIQGGVSGDTSSGGKARLDWVMGGAKADHVIVELGANDALRGIDPAQTEANLDAILTSLRGKQVKVMLAGMLAPPNLGADYQTRFNGLYPALAKKYQVPLYPFFLDGVAAHPDLQLSDGMHPTVQGVGVMVKNMLPAITAWLGSPHS